MDGKQLASDLARGIRNDGGVGGSMDTRWARLDICQELEGPTGPYHQPQSRSHAP